MRFRKFRILADLRITAVLLLLLGIDTLFGTLMQAKWGLWAAQDAFFHSWIALIPLPGGYQFPFIGVPLIGTLAVINLCAVLLFRIPWKIQSSGLLILHCGLIMLLVSAGISWKVSETGFLDLGPMESGSVAESDRDWEVVYTAIDDSGTTRWRFPLRELHAGLQLELGPDSTVFTVLANLENASPGKNNLVIPALGEQDPARWSPVLQLKSEGLDKITLSPLNDPYFLGTGRNLSLRKIPLHLPVSIQLRQFKRDLHQGTQMAAGYASTVWIEENGQGREARISMNHPLRIGDYTLFQSSWRTDPVNGMERSIFAVVRNPVRTAPYVATLLIGLGLLLQMFLQMKSRKAVQTLLALAMLSGMAFAPSQAHATLPKVPRPLLELPILVDGRVKPMETYAQQLLLQVSGKSSVKVILPDGSKETWKAPRWFFGLVLGSDLDSIPFFLIENPETRDALGLSGQDRDRYQQAQIRPVADRLDSLAGFAELVDPKLRTPLQKDLLRIADSWHRVESLRNAFGLFSPDSGISSIPASVRMRIGNLPMESFYDFAQASPLVRPVLDSILKKSPDTLSLMDRQFVDWVNRSLSSADSWADSPFLIFPYPSLQRTEWANPAVFFLNKGPGDSILDGQLQLWHSLMDAWKIASTDSLKFLADTLHRNTLLHAKDLGIQIYRLRMEHVYNQIDPMYKALLLLFFSLIPAGLGLRNTQKPWILFAGILQTLSLSLLVLGISLRMLITSRPPITNLYETFLFAGSASILLLLVWGIFKRVRPAFFLAGLVGSSLLMLARRYGTDGDTMPALAAVLDSNFWLTIHVITITLGYAGVLVAGALAHWHIILFRRERSSSQELAAFKWVRSTLAIGLLLTFLGTLLGGIWADQSWGRFWGWDPKENGALIIILWIAFLFHAFPAGWIGRKAYSFGAVFAIQTVLFAWFGVNLMGVGLHSYGFTEGTIQGLVLFALLEILFLLFPFELLKERTQRNG